MKAIKSLLSRLIPAPAPVDLSRRRLAAQIATAPVAAVAIAKTAEAQVSPQTPDNPDFWHPDMPVTLSTDKGARGWCRLVGAQLAVTVDGKPFSATFIDQGEGFVSGRFLSPREYFETQGNYPKELRGITHERTEINSIRYRDVYSRDGQLVDLYCGIKGRCVPCNNEQTNTNGQIKLYLNGRPLPEVLADYESGGIRYLLEDVPAGVDCLKDPLRGAMRWQTRATVRSIDSVKHKLAMKRAKWKPKKRWSDPNADIGGDVEWMQTLADSAPKDGSFNVYRDPELKPCSDGASKHLYNRMRHGDYVFDVLDKYGRITPEAEAHGYALDKTQPFGYYRHKFITPAGTHTETHAAYKPVAPEPDYDSKPDLFQSDDQSNTLSKFKQSNDRDFKAVDSQLGKWADDLAGMRKGIDKLDGGRS